MRIGLIKNKLQLLSGKLINAPLIAWKRVGFGDSSELYGYINIYGPKERISFGNHCIIRSGYATNPLGGSNRTILFVGKNGFIQCGNYVGISNSCLHIDTKLIIEDHVNIGGDCKIYDSDMHSIEYAYRLETPDTHKKMAPIHIKEGAWIGAHSIILKGVTIGAHSVIGAGSVVTRSIPDNEIWAGNPARFIKKIEG